MSDILDDLRDLHKQATTERSHYYVAATVERAISEIESLRKQFIEGIGGIVENLKKNNEVIKDAEDRLNRAGL